MWFKYSCNPSGWRLGLSALFLPLLMLAAAQSAAAQSRPVHGATDRVAVLDLNNEFYRAFRESDRPGMDAIWGKEGRISLEHPSGWRVEGRDAVMESWEIIMARPPYITCDVEAITFAGGLATVFCNERLNPGSIRMKNIFQREEGVWKMIYHGPVTENEAVS